MGMIVRERCHRCGQDTDWEPECSDPPLCLRCWDIAAERKVQGRGPYKSSSPVERAERDEAIRRLRDEYGLPRREIAELMGVSLSVVYRA